MKTSVMDVHDMLSVLSVDEVEQRIRKVPGVGSATVNFAAGSATVRYDETRLEIADIKSAVRQSEYRSAGEPNQHESEQGPARKLNADEDRQGATMKTSVREVHDMLSVSSVDGVNSGSARCRESKALP